MHKSLTDDQFISLASKCAELPLSERVKLILSEYGELPINGGTSITRNGQEFDLILRPKDEKEVIIILETAKEVLIGLFLSSKLGELKRRVEKCKSRKELEDLINEEINGISRTREVEFEFDLGYLSEKGKKTHSINPSNLSEKVVLYFVHGCACYQYELILNKELERIAVEYNDINEPPKSEEEELTILEEPLRISHLVCLLFELGIVESLRKSYPTPLNKNARLIKILGQICGMKGRKFVSFEAEMKKQLYFQDFTDGTIEEVRRILFNYNIEPSAKLTLSTKKKNKIKKS
jgi:hypothetical protein